LILSRSTFAGTGAYGQHWFDANLSWENMTMSVARVMNLNMFGIPFVGPDVCGYYWNTTAADKQDELCARWIQLATFYPFARSNSAGAPGSKEPWELTEGTHKTRAVKAINQRYQYLR
jgi:alpha-glucosidase (family GH31 glycosyl hydrolase)